MAILSGEWWLDARGQSTFADGDIGDYNHERYAFEIALGLSEEDLSLIDFTAGSGVPYQTMAERWFEEHNIRYQVFDENELIEKAKSLTSFTRDDIDGLYEFLGLLWLEEHDANMEFINWYENAKQKDSRSYALEHLNWIRVKNEYFETWKFDDDALRRIIISDVWDNADDPESLEISNETIVIDEVSSSGFWEVPVKIIFESNITANKIKQYGERVDISSEEEGFSVYNQSRSTKDVIDWLLNSYNFIKWVIKNINDYSPSEFIDKFHNSDELVSFYKDFLLHYQQQYKDHSLTMDYNQFAEGSKDAVNNIRNLKEAQTAPSPSPAGGGVSGESVSSMPGPNSSYVVVSPGSVKNKDIPNPRKKRKKRSQKEEELSEELGLKERSFADMQDLFTAVVSNLEAVENFLSALKEPNEYPVLYQTFIDTGGDISNLDKLFTEISQLKSWLDTAKSSPKFQPKPVKKITRSSILDNFDDSVSINKLMYKSLSVFKNAQKIIKKASLNYYDPMVSRIALDIDNNLTCLVEDLKIYAF